VIEEGRKEKTFAQSKGVAGCRFHVAGWKAHKKIAAQKKVVQGGGAASPTE
jgi:hypothetical protein